MVNEPVAWTSRGIGLDCTPGCFVCGATQRNDAANEYLHNIAAHLRKADETAALACFERGARMDYYHGDDSAPQIKVGACDEHLHALEHLSLQWFISRNHVDRLATQARRRSERERLP